MILHPIAARASSKKLADSRFFARRIDGHDSRVNLFIATISALRNKASIEAGASKKRKASSR